jgi:hypothetical protein
MHRPQGGMPGEVGEPSAACPSYPSILSWPKSFNADEFSMKPLSNEWVDKSEGDFATANREVRVRKAPNYDAGCFHAQQCAE